jgi:hypothetical protein
LIKNLFSDIIKRHGGLLNHKTLSGIERYLSFYNVPGRTI